MTIITTCRVSIASDCELVINSEWRDSELKMLVIKDDSTILVGEMPYSNFDQQVKYFEKELEDYVTWMQDILDGGIDGIEFSLENGKLVWMRRSSPTHKKSCILGRMQLNQATRLDEIKTLKDYLLKFSDFRKGESRSKKAYENLEREFFTFRENFDEVIALKNQMETTLYTRFALILNEKKAKIRELDSIIEQLKSKDSILDASTDESDCEDLQTDEKIDLPKESKCKRSFNDDLDTSKRKRVDSEVIESKKASDDKDHQVSHHEEQNLQSSVKHSAIATTTQTNQTLKEDEDTPDFLSQESECEMELKFDEEKGNGVSPNVTGEQDSEEIF